MRNKKFYALLALLLAAGGVTMQAQGLKETTDLRYWSDIVTEQPDGYNVDANGNVEISTAEGLAWLISTVNGLNGCEPDNFDGRTVTLTEDLTMIGDTVNYLQDFQNYIFEPIGNRANRFMGTFDGAGHKINWLVVYAYEAYYNRLDVGLFGYLYHGTVKNLTLNKGCFVAGPVMDEELLWFDGGFAGISDSLSLVENCVYQMGAENMPSEAYGTAGGLVGLNRNSTVRNCAYWMDWPSLHIALYGGGLVGRNLCEGGYADAVVENCCIYGKLLGSYSVKDVGGLVCFNETKANDVGKKAIVRNCYSLLLGDLFGFDEQGCIVANNSEGSLVEYCYADLTMQQEHQTGLFGSNNGEVRYCTSFIPYQGEGLLSEPVVFEGNETDNLLKALNIWVSLQDESIPYRTWISGDPSPYFGEYWWNVPESEVKKAIVYPNPTNGVLFVETFQETSLPAQTYRISNLMGQTLQTGNLTGDHQPLNVSGLPSGMYLLTVDGATVKFVVK